MNNKDIELLIETLNTTTRLFENYMIESEGEYDEQACQMDEQIQVLKGLLNTEGVDSLGRWLKSKEDSIKALKAERDYISRKIKANENTIDYIKFQLNKLLKALDIPFVKGANGYKFERTKSVKTEVDKEVLKSLYQEQVEKKLRAGKKPIIPADVTITLGASVKALPEDATLPAYYTRTETDTTKFSKPRANKEG